MREAWPVKWLEVRPGCCLAYGLVEGVAVADRPPELDAAFRSFIAEVRQRYQLDTLRDEPFIRAYRDFFWRMNVDPTKHRPAAEALLRRMLQGKAIPRISNVVDACNLVSAQTRVTLSTFDASRITPPLLVRRAESGEEVLLIGNRRKRLGGTELLLCDQGGPIAIYAHSDTERTKVTQQTTALLLVAYGVPGVDEDAVWSALLQLTEAVIRYAGGRTVWKHLSAPSLA